ncbi:hypothetical protein IB274_27265 [Pseudomonas sp. PDM18]|uniref:hypothetical protein n=1 Tax=Pseudomonas sp. PDM18 TaxID=2769253 RepID=UPI00177DA50C|nr:hypothetical protein [Pseudomonas sp. PDM18]MBD9680433.1 hypothetical protein [Pseudomonas sp. PDM18]
MSKFEIFSVHLVDKLNAPITGLKCKIICEGSVFDGSSNDLGQMGPILLYENSLSPQQLSDIRKGLRQKLPEAAVSNVGVKLSIYIVTDTGAEKLLHEEAVQWGRKIIVARSNWVKVRMPLIRTDTEGKQEESYRKEMCGFAEVEYEIGKNTGNFATTKITLCDLPKKIVDTALRHRESTEWSYWVAKHPLPHPVLGNPPVIGPKTNKCSLFVYDVLTEVGLSVPLVERGRSTYIPFYQKLYPPLADTWADQSRLSKNWIAATSPLPGDVGAYVESYIDATGHVGFVVAPGVTVSAAEDKIRVNDVGFRVAKMSEEQREYNSALGGRGEHDFFIFRRLRA